MKVSELRIGNWVKIKDKIFEDGWETGYDVYKTNEFQITGFNDGSSMKDCKVICFYEIPSKMFGGFIHSGCRDIDIDPIPLTEEWLLRFGGKPTIVEDYPIYFIYPFNIEYYENECIVLIGGFSEIKIKYVHQLQNLYFALTGEELILTENETN